MLLRCETLPAQAIEGFVANAPNTTKLSLGIKENFALVTTMVKAHPCLRADFQVFLRNDGAVLNIDLDRCDHSGQMIYSGQMFRPNDLFWANGDYSGQMIYYCGKRSFESSSQLILDKALEHSLRVSAASSASP